MNKDQISLAYNSYWMNGTFIIWKKFKLLKILFGLSYNYSLPYLSMIKSVYILRKNIRFGELSMIAGGHLLKLIENRLFMDLCRMSPCLVYSLRMISVGLSFCLHSLQCSKLTENLPCIQTAPKPATMYTFPSAYHTV